MEAMYTMCAWCERTAAEIAQEDALDDPEDALATTLIAGKRIMLCEKCRTTFVPEAKTDLGALLETPIDFPPGVTAVEHCCPQLQYEGKTDEEATFEMIMERQGDYYVATCPWCKVSIRSLADENAF